MCWQLCFSNLLPVLYCIVPHSSNRRVNAHPNFRNNRYDLLLLLWSLKLPGFFLALLNNQIMFARHNIRQPASLHLFSPFRWQYYLIFQAVFQNFSASKLLLFIWDFCCSLFPWAFILIFVSNFFCALLSLEKSCS